MKLLIIIKYFLFSKIIFINTLHSNSYWEEKNPTKLSSEINLTKRQCIFPSVHKRKAIYECQHIDISPPNEQISMTNQYSLESKWWCPLTDNFDHYPEWQNCPVTTSTYAGNQPGKQCHFPFIYRKRLYSTCIRTNGELYFDNINDPMPIDNGKSGYWWCSTTKDFDFDGLWTKCRPQLAYQLPCYFKKSINNQQLHYQNQYIGGFIQTSQYECQPFAGHWICHTELNQLRECPHSIQHLHNIKTEGGNDPGFPCYFPFQATLTLHNHHHHNNNDNQYVDNIKQNFTQCLPGTHTNHLSIYPTWIGYWCSTTDNFDRDHLWTRCNIDFSQTNQYTSSPSSSSSSTSSSSSSDYHIKSLKLSEIWSKLHWLSILSLNEKQNILQITTNSTTTNKHFMHTLHYLEYLRITWDILITKHNVYYDRIKQIDQFNDQSQLELTWWIWLTPFWWLTYQMNQTYTMNNAYITSMNTFNHNHNDNNNNPLVYGLNLPLWLNDWSESAWNNYALNMREQWNQLTVYLYYQWLKTWLIAFIFGLITGIILIIIILCIIFIWLKKSLHLHRMYDLLRHRHQHPHRHHHHRHDDEDGDVDDKKLELTSSNSMNQINIEQSRNMHNSLMYTHTTNNHFNTLYSIHDIDTTQMNRNNQHYTLEKLINNSIDSCCCHYLLTKDNTTNNTTTLMNTTDICINSSINHVNNTNNITEYIKCLLDELLFQHSNNNNNDNDMYTKCIHKMSSIINAYLQQHQQHDEYIDEKEFHKCCLHHTLYCKHLCHKCICCHHHCSLLHCKYTLHNYHYTTYYDINNDNSNNYNQQIDNYYNEINQQENEPTAPPPSYDQIIPIL